MLGLEGAGRTRPTDATLALADWRRRVFDLYGTVRRTEPRVGWDVWRETRDRLFKDHGQSPLGSLSRAGFGGLPLFAYDPAFRFEVGTRLASGRAEPLEVPLGADGAVALTPFAETVGLMERCGAELTLYWIEGYGGGIFLPFRDATTGQDTYGGGRYLLDTIKGADLGTTPDGRVILDFNFSYNPSCAYDARWVCPLSPAGNALPVAVWAGERAPQSG